MPETIEEKLRRLAERDPEYQSLLEFQGAKARTGKPLTRVMSTPKLVELNQKAIDTGFNRCLDQQSLWSLIDPDGVHLVRPIMIHEHKHGELCAPHMRCEVWLKSKGTMEPDIAFLDMSLLDFFDLDVPRGAVKET